MSTLGLLVKYSVLIWEVPVDLWRQIMGKYGEDGLVMCII